MALVDVDNPTSDPAISGCSGCSSSGMRKLNGRRIPASSGRLSIRPDMARWAGNLMMVDVPGDIAGFPHPLARREPGNDVRQRPGPAPASKP